MPLPCGDGFQNVLSPLACGLRWMKYLFSPWPPWINKKSSKIFATTKTCFGDGRLHPWIVFTVHNVYYTFHIFSLKMLFLLRFNCKIFIICCSSILLIISINIQNISCSWGVRPERYWPRCHYPGLLGSQGALKSTFNSLPLHLYRLINHPRTTLEDQKCNEDKVATWIFTEFSAPSSPPSVLQIHLTLALAF